ncbi:MAG: hypothetical protein ACXWLG_04280 [Myxococcaceae bacterium]
MDETLTLAAIARLIAADTLQAHPPLGGRGAEDLRHRLETALRTAVREERLACAAECERRRTLWTETEERSSTPSGLRAEARCRANEAAVLADAIRTRSTA